MVSMRLQLSQAPKDFPRAQTLLDPHMMEGSDPHMEGSGPQIPRFGGTKDWARSVWVELFLSPPKWWLIELEGAGLI